METSRDQNGGDMNHRVLIIEDEYLIAMDVEDMVSSSPVEADVVGLASNKENALILAPLADIALVDVNLSDGPSGPEIGRILAEEFGVTVIFMTANPELVATGVKGALGVVRKPVDSRTIEQSLEYAIARRSHQRAPAPRSMQIFAA
ncbi:response regulator [Rhizobium sp. LjRoot30]|uniref:response regulator n=1 Tax=Rhizobium sp. LjRoot30 TaxID=3342320 RepID=UPI003ED0D61C